MIYKNKFRVGVDVGGTNTDICAINEKTGDLIYYKLPSTIKDQAIAIENGIKIISSNGKFSPSSVSRFVHGTTVATNCILEGKGAKMALITTKGFKDLLEIGRQKRPDLYDLQVDKKKPLVPRNLRYEIKERIDYQGKVVEELDFEEIMTLLHELKEKEIESIAVLFLNSFVSTKNEEKIKQLIKRKMPNVFLSISSEVSNQFREYERLCAVVINSYVGPKMKKYLNNMEYILSELGIKKIYINHSNGGIMSIKEASKFSVKTALSGPAAGVIGAESLTKLINCSHAITIDVGGTSTDISLIINGESLAKKDKEISGYPVRIPSLDITTIGAGGGSVARVDSGGILKVGPESAGASPGPACYGIGGIKATITDARVVLGHLNQKALLGGRLPIYYKNSTKSIRKIADKINMNLYETAEGVILVNNSNIIRGIKRVIVERGYGSGEFNLVAFGGAGPLCAAELMKELNISKVIIPRVPGLLAAYGLLVENIKKDFVRTKVINLNEVDFSLIIKIFNQIEKKAKESFDSEDIPVKNRIVIKSLDMRYKGQNYEVTVNYSDNKIKNIESLKEVFYKEYRRLYTYSYDEPILIINFNLTVIGLIQKPKIQKGIVVQSRNSPKALIGERRAYFNGNFTLTSIYNRELLFPGNLVTGPAIIEQMDSTTIIPPGQKGTIDEYYNIIIENI